MIAKIKAWLAQPLHPNTDVVSLTLYVGLIFVLAWLWASVIGGVVRIGKDVAA